MTHTRGTSLLNLLIREANDEISLLKILVLLRDPCKRKDRGQSLSKGHYRYDFDVIAFIHLFCDNE